MLRWSYIGDDDFCQRLIACVGNSDLVISIFADLVALLDQFYRFQRRSSIHMCTIGKSTESALQAVTTAVLQTLPRLIAVKQTLTFLVWQGSKQPSLKSEFFWQLLCSSPSGTLSVTTTSSAVQLPRFVTVMV